MSLYVVVCCSDIYRYHSVQDICAFVITNVYLAFFDNATGVPKWKSNFSGCA